MANDCFYEMTVVGQEKLEDTTALTFRAIGV